MPPTLSLVDASKALLPPILSADLCIVGAGAAGITLASALLPTGRDICLIESGGLAPDADTQALYDLDVIGYPPRPDYMSRARYFGGSCNLWAGRSMALNPIDFEKREWVPHSGWPIPYDEVAKYYRGAGRILGLPDLEEVSTREVPRANLGARAKALQRRCAGPHDLALGAQSPALRATLRERIARGEKPDGPAQSLRDADRREFGRHGHRLDRDEHTRGKAHLDPGPPVRAGLRRHRERPPAARVAGHRCRGTWQRA